MLELKKNKHNKYYHCTYLYIVNAVIVKMLLTSQLKPDLANKTKTILHNPLVQYSRGLN